MDVSPGGLLQTLGGIFLGSLLTLGGNYLAKTWDWGKAYRDQAEIASANERSGVLKAYQELVVDLRDARTSFEADRKALWKEISTLQVSLIECQRLHREDANKIQELQNQNAQQAWQIADLRVKLENQEKDWGRC